MNHVSRGDFVEIIYTGRANGEIFDSNKESDLKQLNPEAKPEKTIVCIGEGMLVHGLDKALEGKELGKEYTCPLTAQESFGARKQNLIKTIPSHVFLFQRVVPRIGMTVVLDNMMARIISVSGSRVITDFNNPLAGKEIEYTFTITRTVHDAAEKTEALCSFFWKFNPKVETKGEEVVLTVPAEIKMFAESFKERFEKLVGKKIVLHEEVRSEAPVPQQDKA